MYSGSTPEEDATRTSNQEFVLLGQPCDISLRPDGKRDQATAFLVPMRRKAQPSENRLKSYTLPFVINGQYMVCDFRNTSVARLAILDLASYRSDGRVRYDADQSRPEGLLVGHELVYDKRTSAARNELAGQSDAVAINSELQMTFTTENAFKHVHTATIKGASTRDNVERPSRVTWRTMRCGRIRMPYAAALLEEFMNVFSRRAFDLDYLKRIS